MEQVHPNTRQQRAFAAANRARGGTSPDYIPATPRIAGRSTGPSIMPPAIGEYVEVHDAAIASHMTSRAEQQGAPVVTM